ncbi:MAG: ATP-dependent Clp protease proteolytic subunit [Geminicoccaceae bacterium]
MAHASWHPARHDLGYGLLLLGSTLLVVIRVVLLVVVVGSELASCGFSTCVRQEKGFVQVGGLHALGARYFVRLVEAEMATGADPQLPVVVRVDSPGGDFPAATRMTKALLAPGTPRPVRIEVLAGGRCESMCTVLWAAAAERVAAPVARFMFHGPGYGARRQPGAGLEAKAAVMEQAVRRVDPVLADYLAARQAFVPAGPKVELTAAEIAALGGNYLRLDPALR